MTIEATSTPLDRALSACWDAADASWAAVGKLLAWDLNGAWATAYPSLEACGTAVYSVVAPFMGAG